jgi:hypothetical protein
MAQKKISQLVAVTGPTGPDVIPIVSGGATRKVTLSTLSTYFGNAGATGPTGPSGSGATGPTGAAGAGEIYQSDTAPGSAAAGATWLDTSTGRYFTRYQNLWVEVGGEYVA